MILRHPTFLRFRSLYHEAPVHCESLLPPSEPERLQYGSARRSAAGPLARALNARQAVSYGTSPRDTLTFSSLEGDRLCLAVQRELVTLGGAVVEQQELVLPFSTGASPLPFLAAAGTLLLLGVPPEELPARLRSPV